MKESDCIVHTYDNLEESMPKNLNDKIIYECYKPQNLYEAKEFTKLILNQRKVLSNEIEEFNQENAMTDRSLGNQVQDFDYEKQIKQANTPSLKRYFTEYIARATSIRI